MSYREYKPFTVAQPPANHPPNHEPCKVIQPADPFHNAFYYTWETQNNLLGLQHKPEVIQPVRYARRRKHEFIPIELTEDSVE